MNIRLQSNQKLMKIRECGGSIIGLDDAQSDNLPSSLYPTAPIKDITWHGRDSMPVEDEAQYYGIYGSDEAYEMVHDAEDNGVVQGAQEATFSKQQHHDQSQYDVSMESMDLRRGKDQKQIQVDKLSNRIIENILNEQESTSTVKKSCHARGQNFEVEARGANQIQQQNFNLAGQTHLLSPQSMYLGKAQQSGMPANNSFKTQTQSHSMSQNQEADQSLSVSFLTAQNQQSQCTHQQTPDNQSFQTSSQYQHKEKDSFNNPYQNSFKYTVKGSDNFQFLTNPNSSNQIVLIDDFQQTDEVNNCKDELQQSESDINRAVEHSESNKLQNQSLGFSSDQDNAFKKSFNKVDKSLQNLNPMQIEELLVPQQQNRSSVEPDTQKIADQSYLNQFPDDSTVVIDNLQGSSYLDVSYKLPPGHQLLESVEILKDSQLGTLQQSTIKRDFHQIQKHDFNTTIKMALRRDESECQRIPVQAGATGQTPFSKSPPAAHPQIEWLNRVQSSMKKDLESNKKNKLKSGSISILKEQQRYQADSKSRCSNNRLMDSSNNQNSNEQYSRQHKSIISQNGNSVQKSSTIGEPSLSKSKAQKKIEALRNTRFKKDNFNCCVQVAGDQLEIGDGQNTKQNHNASKSQDNRINQVRLNSPIRQDAQNDDLKGPTSIILHDLLNKPKEFNTAVKRNTDWNEKTSPSLFDNSRMENTAALKPSATFFVEECDLDEAELDDEEQDAVKWKLDSDWDIKQVPQGQQTMLLNNQTSKPGIEIGLDIRNMTSMGTGNANETGLMHESNDQTQTAPVNKQSVFFKRKHKKNFSMHVGGTVQNHQLNQTGLIWPNDSYGGIFHHRTGSANGLSEIQPNLNQTQFGLAGIANELHKKERLDASSPSSKTIKQHQQQLATVNLNNYSGAEFYSQVPTTCNQSVISRAQTQKPTKAASKKVNDPRKSAASRHHISPQTTCNRLYSIGKQKLLKKREDEDNNLNKSAQKRLNSQEPMNSQISTVKNSQKYQNPSELRSSKNQRFRSATRINGLASSQQKPTPKTFAAKQSIKSEKMKAPAGNQRKQRGCTPQDFSHKYEELMQKKQKTQEKVAKLAQEKKELEEKQIEAQLNPALSKKVTKNREMEALERFNNYGKNHLVKMEYLKQKKDKQEEDMLRKLFQPKIIKNYKTTNERSRQESKRQNCAKSVNTCNNFSRNDNHSYDNGLSLDFGKQINEDKSNESNMNYTTVAPKALPFKLKQAQSFDDNETQKNSEQNNNHSQNKTLDLRVINQSSMDQKSNIQNLNLGISCQQSLHSNMLDGLDLDSEAFDRLESFYGKMSRKSSLPGVFIHNQSVKKNHNSNTFAKKKNTHIVPKLDLDGLHGCKHQELTQQKQQVQLQIPEQSLTQANNCKYSPDKSQNKSLQLNEQSSQHANQQTTIHLIPKQESSFKVEEQSEGFVDNGKETIQKNQSEFVSSALGSIALVNDFQELEQVQKTESDDEFEQEDIDEYASQKVKPLLNSELKLKFNQPNDLKNKAFKQENVQKVNKPNQTNNQVVHSSQKPPFLRTSVKPSKQLKQENSVFQLRTKNSVFKGSKGSFTQKDLSLVGKIFKKMEQQGGNSDNLSKYEMSLTEIQASSSSMRMAKN